MSNGPGSSLKRVADAAFSGENGQKSKQSRRKRSKTSSLQQDPTPEPMPLSPRSKASNSQNEPPKTPLLPKPEQSNLRQDALTNTPQIRVSEGQKENQNLKKGRRKQHRSLRSGWSLSAVDGGRFAEYDPILVQGDRYMILAVRTQILVYSTETSVLVRSLRLGDQEKITSYTACAADKNCLFVSTYSGLVLKWDWTMGHEIKRWRCPEKLLCVSEQWKDQKTTPSSTLLLFHEISDQNRRVSLATLLDSSDQPINESVVLEGKSLASCIKVLDQGKSLVLYADNKILLGQAVKSPDEAPISYIWREVWVPKNITSIDARSHNLCSGNKKSRLAIDIIVGCENGSILIYDDIIFRLASKEKNPREEDIVSRRFHWHRNEVLAVKWSLDGNYIISGGHETVMVIWQLDTGQQQFLPHLSAAIQNLTISQTGSAYAIHLADNSAMVLSTSELQPTAYISGLIMKQRRSNEKKAKRIPAVLPHTESTSVAVAVPKDYLARSNASANATFLQIYNIRTQQQSRRQALVRNNTTALNVDPLGQPIQEPDVTHLKISHDGKWLATVDEWTPPDNDLKPLCQASNESLSNVKEVVLRFWANNESTGSWELATKIENLNSTRRTSFNSILDLAANPQRPEFSTISSDGHVNVWTPKSRHRNGMPVVDRVGSQLYTWTCTNTIEVSVPLRRPVATASALAYSTDGSVLAVSSNKSPFIHFLDPLTGVVQYALHGSHPGLFSYLTFVKHHLVTISKDLRVYNTVSGDLLYALALNSSVCDIRLAANQHDQTFAAVCLLPAFMSKENGGFAKPRSQIMVFDLKSASPIFRKIVDGTVEILLSLPGESGYLIINDEAEVVYLRRPGSHTARRIVEAPLAEEPLRVTIGLEDVFGKRGFEARQEANGVITNLEKDEKGQIMQDYKAHSSLSEVFNNHSTNLPVRELFEQVVGVIKRKEFQ